ncbi:MAG: TlpA disulfide reductase family protein [Dehalococcoidia bacterium]
MSGPWLISYIVLWGIVFLQGAVVFLLLRQLGMMYLGTAQGVARDGLAPGTAAPEFAVQALDGRGLSLADFRGLPLLLVFGSPSCAPCKALIPDLNAFAQEYAGDLRVLFLSRGELELTQRFAEENAVEVTVAVHPDESLPDQFKVRVTPFAHMLDAEGVVQAKGLANNRQHLDMLLSAAKLGDHTNGAKARRLPAGGGEPVATEGH